MDIKKQCEEYLRHKYLYFIVGKPVLSDYEFDIFEKNLKNTGDELALKVTDIVDFPSLKTIEELGLNINNIAPITKVKLVDDDINHYTLMLSTKKAQMNIEEDLTSNEDYNKVELFFNYAKSDYYISEPKFDGNGLDIIYKDGKLFQILTRGDSQAGKDKTKKLSFLVPSKIDTNEPLIEVRGEAIVKQKIWEDNFKIDDPEKGTNSRNWVAGIIRKEDYIPEELFSLELIAFSMVKVENGLPIYIENEYDELKRLGFNKSCGDFLYKKIKNINDFKDLYFEYKNYRENISEYQLDGIVLKYPEKMRAKLSHNKKYPFWSLAIKFKPQIASSTILRIEWQPSTTGEFSPVAVIKPTVMPDGRILKRAGLHNLSYIIKNKAFPYSTVTLKLCGDIIGQVVDVIEPSPFENEYMKEYEDFLNNKNNN